MTDLVKCSKCKRENPLSEMYEILEKDKEKQYECAVDEMTCQKIVKENKKIRGKKEREFDQSLRELPKEEQFEKKYGLNFEDLEENSARYRDASIHYTHKLTGDIYKWNYQRKYWYTTFRKDNFEEE